MSDELREILAESWEVCTPEDAARAADQINVIDGDGLKVADVFEWREFPEKLLARGRLIAAAPALYVACEAAVARIGELTDSGIWGPRSWTEELLAPLLAALAKARGEVAGTSPPVPVDTGWRVAMHTDRATGLDIQWTCPKCGLGPVNYRDSSSDYADIFYHCLACDKRWCAEGADA